MKGVVPNGVGPRLVLPPAAIQSPREQDPAEEVEKVAKSRFFGDSSPESASNSPAFGVEASPAAIKGSPFTLFCGVIKSDELTPAEVTVGFEALQAKKDTPLHKEKGNALRQLGTTLAQSLYGQDKVRSMSPGQMQKAYALLADNCFLSEILGRAQAEYRLTLNKVPSSPHLSALTITIFNVEHILNGDVNGGFHYATPRDPRLTNVRISSLSDHVFSAFHASKPEEGKGNSNKAKGGKEKTKEKIKFSTFFNSERMQPQALFKRLTDPNREVLAREEGRVLFLNHGSSFLIEAYERGGLGASAFPIFFHAIFKENATYNLLPDMVVQSSEVFEAATSLMLKHGCLRGKCVKYTIDNWDGPEKSIVKCLVIDVAEAFSKKTNVCSGVYFFIPVDLLPKTPKMQEIVSFFTGPTESP